MIDPGGPTLAAINAKLPLPAAPQTTLPAPATEAAALNPRPGPEPLGARDLTTRGIGDTLAEARAEDPFGDIFGGRGENPVIADHVDKWLAEDAADIRAQRERATALGVPSRRPGKEAGSLFVRPCARRRRAL